MGLEGMPTLPDYRLGLFVMSFMARLEVRAYARFGRKLVAADLAKWLEFFPRVAGRIGQRAGTLSGGEQQMVAMARALMGRPRLLCMDEPTMGLSPLYVDRVCAI
jgi:branched-chain amino acid transport system ATP-binding protein